MARILRPKDTEAKTGICDRHLRDLEAKGLFPRRFSLNPNGGRAVGHLESEVDDWIKSRADVCRMPVRPSSYKAKVSRISAKMDALLDPDFDG